jgi:hypothetical protein
MTGLDTATVALIWDETEMGLENARPVLIARTAATKTTRNLGAERTMKDCSF